VSSELVVVVCPILPISIQSIFRVTEVGAGGCQLIGRRKCTDYVRSLQGVWPMRAMAMKEGDRSTYIVHVIYMLKNILVLIVVSY
jgi:hypothetical protein